MRPLRKHAELNSIIKSKKIKIYIYIYNKHNQENEHHPLECIFSNMEIASIAIHATISVDILNPQKRVSYATFIKTLTKIRFITFH